MAACQSNEVSIETYDLFNGVFTYYFLDAYSQGYTSLEEQFSLASQRTAQYCGQYDIPQHPVLYDGIAGYTYLEQNINLEFTQDDMDLSYTLNVYGSGQIFDIFLTLYTEKSSFTYNFSSYVSSETGFGPSSGTLRLPTDETIEECEVIMEVKGYNYLTVSRTFPKKKEEKEEIEPKPEAIPWIIIIPLICFTSVASVATVYLIRKRRKLLSFNDTREVNMENYARNTPPLSPKTHCPYCGSIKTGQSKYCTNCGKLLIG